MTTSPDTPNNESSNENAHSKYESEQTIVSGEIKAAVQHLTESDPSLSALLSEKVLNTITTVAISSVSEHHSGPYPPARQLRDYNEILPEGASRLFSMTEDEQKHRHFMERRMLELDHENMLLKHKVSMSEIAVKESSLKVLGWQVFRRQTYALTLSVAVLGIGFWLMKNNEPGFGVGVIATNFVAIALAFLHD
ncbi:DUF2335 domain-containing protein, partial [Pseudomonas gingeri]